MKRLKQISLEEANEIALRNGYESYGELHQELYRHGITLEQFVRNGESFEKKQKNSTKFESEGISDVIYNALQEAVETYKYYVKDLKKKLPQAPTKEMEKETKVEIAKYEAWMKEIKKYQNEHFVIGAKK